VVPEDGSAAVSIAQHAEMTLMTQSADAIVRWLVELDTKWYDDGWPSVLAAVDVQLRAYVLEGGISWDEVWDRIITDFYGIPQMWNRPALWKPVGPDETLAPTTVVAFLSNSRGHDVAADARTPRSILDL
jgi:hypothetical protein